MSKEKEHAYMIDIKIKCVENLCDVSKKIQTKKLLNNELWKHIMCVIPMKY